MKKIIISWLLCFATVYIFGQEVCAYDKGQKICYETSATRFICRSVTPDAAIDIINTLQHTEVGNIREIYNVGEGLFVVEMQDISKDELLELRRKLNAREDVKYTTPLIVDGTGHESFAYTNEIIVSLKSNDDYAILQQCAADYSINDIRELYDFHILTLPHNSAKDAPDIAIELYETNLFNFVEPNFLFLCVSETCPYWWLNDDGNTHINPEQTIVVYPNPVSDVLYVDLANKTAASYDIRLYNSQGKMCRQTTAKEGIVELNISTLPDGVYLLNIYDRNASKSETHKIIVKHGNHYLF